MKIEKGAFNKDSYRENMMYYSNARSAMFELLQAMCLKGLVNKILLPGYIGWSPKEGSGIFDPIHSIDGLDREYYQMTEMLQINQKDLLEKAIDEKIVVLIVNYFGFRDDSIELIIRRLKERNVWVIEDNAHGLYTYYKFGRIDVDATFFSLHKMLPFERGGALLLFNDELKELKVFNQDVNHENIFDYNLGEIARKRTNNYLSLDSIIRNDKYSHMFIPLKSEEAILASVPQTYPVLIKKGNRDKIYEVMNEAGYGVVSLYHTMIPELRGDIFINSQKVSKQILNLPIHQDVDTNLYGELIEKLVWACEITDKSEEKG